MRHSFLPACVLLVATLLWPLHAGSLAAGQAPSAKPPGSCFILHEIGVGEVRRAPADGCAVRRPPMSTFKIPHALAGLDAGVLAGPETTFRYDGATVPYPAWAHDHTLRTAMRDSVVWYFQRLAERLGHAREAEYLKRFDYGNRDLSSGLTTFWLNRSLEISADEQLRFLLRLYGNQLRVSSKALAVVKEILIQPRGMVVNAAGSHPFAAPWPDDLVLSAKTGGGGRDGGPQIRWIVGHAQRGPRAWVFVSNVAGGPDTPPLAAVDLAARALREAGVW